MASGLSQVSDTTEGEQGAWPLWTGGFNFMLLMAANSIPHVLLRNCLKEDYSRSEITRREAGGMEVLLRTYA